MKKEDEFFKDLLVGEIKSISPGEVVKYYEECRNVSVFVWEDCSYFCDEINERVTLYRSIKNNNIVVGFEVYGYKLN